MKNKLLIFILCFLSQASSMNDSLLLDALGHDAFDKLDLKLHHDLNTMPLSTLSPEEIQTFVEKLIIIDSNRKMNR